MTDLHPYLGPTADNLACLPDALTQRPQWVLWRGVEKVDEASGEIRLNKVPYDPQTLHKASTTDPTTWGTFAYCVEALPVVLEEWEQASPEAYRGGGLGYVFSDEDPYTGIDLDHCVDPGTGQVQAWAQARVAALASYTEITPSRTGLHIIVAGTLPPHGRKQGPVEMYSYARFFTMTGWHLPETPPTIEARQEALAALHLTFFGPPQAPRAPAAPGSITLEDTALLAKARAAKNGAKFTTLWDGDTALHAGDDSSADLALCCMLAFWTQDPAQLDRLFRQSGLMRTKWDSTRGDSTYGARTIDEALARQTEHYRPGGAAQVLLRLAGANGQAPPAEEEEAIPFGDYYNALAFVREHGQALRYCYRWNSWLVWVGTHWQRDTSGAVMRLAKQTVKRLAMQAPSLDDFSAKLLMAHVKASLSTPKLKAMIESAQSEPGIPVQPEDFDTNPWLLNVANGTLDLRTGTLRPHARTDLLTFVLAVAYDATATCPAWHAFLDRIMAKNPNLLAFLQRAIGYALTGVIREHVLLILWGSGRNGKSTFLNLLRMLLGAYAMKAPSELLLVSHTDRHPTERADLWGKRFVSAIETEQGRRLAEVFVKEATGGDPIRARRMREDFWEFQPTHKVLLATNHKPVISGTDNAIWERIRLVPFTVTIPPHERDTTLPDKLAQELPGILAWAVQGCLAWQQDGLGFPAEVQQATAGYRSEMDVLGQFIDECCLVGPDYRTKASDLYEAYKRWCDQQGMAYTIQRTWGLALSERGYERFTNNGTWYRGLGLRDHTPPATEGNGRSDTAGSVDGSVDGSVGFGKENSPGKHATEGAEPTEGKNGIHSSIFSRDSVIRKVPSVGSVGSVPEGEPVDGSVGFGKENSPGKHATEGAEPTEGKNGIQERCPECRCTSLLVLGTYRKCPLCAWKGPAGKAAR